MKRDDIAARKHEVLSAAAERWESKAAEAVAAQETLAREGRLAATSAEFGKSFLCREVLKSRPTDESFLYERIIGPTIDFVDHAPNEAAEQAGRPVARIVELQARSRVVDGFATGFLIAPGVLVTNWHVFAEARDAANCGAQFGYQKNRGGGIDGGVVFEIDATAFFLSDKTLDIAIVGVSPAAIIGRRNLGEVGTIKFVPAQGKYLVGNPINIIQHPDGKPKRWAVSENGLRIEPKDDDLFLDYLTDTLKGSSGSPAFNHDWELVAVHHSGVPQRLNGQIVTTRGTPWHPSMPEDDINWVANEGARVSKICSFLAGVRLPDPAKQATLANIVREIVRTSGVGSESGPVSLQASELLPVPREAPMVPEPSVNVVVNGTANFFFSQHDQVGRSAVPGSPVPPATIGIEKKLKFDGDYENRPGYSSTFLKGFEVPLPMAPQGEVLKKGNAPIVLDYHHYSLVMHKKRRLAMWTAANVDYDEHTRRFTRKQFGSDTWKPDPRIPIEAQIEDLEFYEPAAKFDRGHLVRRDDVAWGQSEQEEVFGNSDSFHWTNCTPQHEGFNRDMFQYQGLWGQLENHITRQAEFVENKCILFAGPVLTDSDPARDFGSGIKVQVPMVFWKVVIVVEKTPKARLRAYGFFLDQTDAIERYGWEGRFQAGKFKEQQASLSEISHRSRVKFADSVYEADPLANVPAESSGRSLTSLQDLVLR